MMSSFLRHSGFTLLVIVLFLSSGPASAQVPVRIATWNMEALGTPGSSQWTDSLAVIQRLGADVVGIQEIWQGEQGDFSTLASQAGYAQWQVGAVSGTLSGNLRLGFLSVHPIVFFQSHSAASLSPDPSANDITRDILEAHVQVPGAPTVLGVFNVHLKSASGDTNDFRRAVELIRVQQAIASFQAGNPGAPYVLLGDMNEDIADGPFGNSWTSLPGGLPTTFSLGSDIVFPVVYEPFASFVAQGSVIANATQEDSTTIYITRPASGRRLDYIFQNGTIQNDGDEVYYSLRDNGIDDLPIGNWLSKVGSPLPSGTSAASSDHLPVFGDFTLSSGNPPATMLAPASVVVSEYMNNPAAVFDTAGEWLELFNTTGDAIDLVGFTIRDHGIDTFILPSLTIPPRGHVVLARNGSPALNGGVLADFTWPAGSFVLSNGFDEIEVVDPTGVVMDSVVYDDGATFPDPDGKSVERRNTTALPWPSNFGEATTPFGAGDLGTPGATNSLSMGPVFTSLGISGPLTAGTTANVSIYGGGPVASRPYILAASECMSPGLLLPFSGRELHLCTSMLFDLSLTPGNPFFVGFSGALSPLGLASASVAIPAVPGLTGLTIYVSGVVLDPFAIEGVLSIVDVKPLTIN